MSNFFLKSRNTNITTIFSMVIFISGCAGSGIPGLDTIPSGAIKTRDGCYVIPGGFAINSSLPTIWKGGCSDNLATGSGVLRAYDYGLGSIVYEGQMKDGAISGPGKLTARKDGATTVMTGTAFMGVISSANGEATLNDGRKLTGQTLYGKFYGPVKVLYPDGTLKTVNYSQGIAEGSAENLNSNSLPQAAASRTPINASEISQQDGFVFHKSADGKSLEGSGGPCNTAETGIYMTRADYKVNADAVRSGTFDKYANVFLLAKTSTSYGLIYPVDPRATSADYDRLIEQAESLSPKEKSEPSEISRLASIKCIQRNHDAYLSAVKSWFIENNK